MAKQKTLAKPYEIIRDERDERDKNRQHSPLRPAKDALVIDTTNLSINEVISKVMALIKA